VTLVLLCARLSLWRVEGSTAVGGCGLHHCLLRAVAVCVVHVCCRDMPCAVLMACCTCRTCCTGVDVMAST